MCKCHAYSASSHFSIYVDPNSQLNGWLIHGCRQYENTTGLPTYTQLSPNSAYIHMLKEQQPSRRNYSFRKALAQPVDCGLPLQQRNTHCAFTALCAPQLRTITVRLNLDTRAFDSMSHHNSLLFLIKKNKRATFDISYFCSVKYRFGD